MFRQEISFVSGLHKVHDEHNMSPFCLYLYVWISHNARVYSAFTPPRKHHGGQELLAAHTYYPKLFTIVLVA